MHASSRDTPALHLTLRLTLRQGQKEIKRTGLSASCCRASYRGEPEQRGQADKLTLTHTHVTWFWEAHPSTHTQTNIRTDTTPNKVLGKFAEMGGKVLRCVTCCWSEDASKKKAEWKKVRTDDQQGVWLVCRLMELMELILTLYFSSTLMLLLQSGCHTVEPVEKKRKKKKEEEKVYIKTSPIWVLQI